MSAAPGTAELYIQGQIEGGENFQESGVSCDWELVTGRPSVGVPAWPLCEGYVYDGRTHTDMGKGSAVWSHPIDAKYEPVSIDGWPRFLLSLISCDPLGIEKTFAYGMAYVPLTPGYHEIECSVWRPTLTRAERVADLLLDGSTQLEDIDMVFDSKSRAEYMETESAGKVRIHISVLLRNEALLDMKGKVFKTMNV